MVILFDLHGIFQEHNLGVKWRPACTMNGIIMYTVHQIVSVLQNDGRCTGKDTSHAWEGLQMFKILI
jgi:hypothetical protein